MAYTMGRRVPEEEARELARKLRANDQEDLAEIVEATTEDPKNYSFERLIHDIVGVSISAFSLDIITSFLDAHSPEKPEAVDSAVRKQLPLFYEIVKQGWENLEDMKVVCETLQARLPALYEALGRKYKNTD